MRRYTIFGTNLSTFPSNVVRKERLLKENDRIGQPHGHLIDYIDYTSIDWFHDYLQYKAFSRLPSLNWVSFLWKETQVWVLLFLLGVSVGIIEVFMGYLALYLHDIKSGYCVSNVLFHKNKCCKYLLTNCEEWEMWSSQQFFKPMNSLFINFFIYLSLSLAFGFLAVAITLEFSYKQPLRFNSPNTAEINTSSYGAGSGLPEIKTILSGFIIRGYLGTRTLVVKLVALIFTVASGLILSIQGPLIHISCCLGNILSRLSDKYNTNEGKKREFLSCASAVGVSAAFGSPIGGVLFSLEETSYYFPSKTMIRSYFGAMVAALTVSLINFNRNRLVLFQVSQVHSWTSIELVPYALLGLFGGIFGVVYNDSVIYLAKLRKLHTINPIREVLLMCFITALLSYPFEITKLSIPALLSELFSSCSKERQLNLLCNPNESQLLYLSYAFIIKAILSTFSTGLKIPGGTFLPVMSIGALMGRIVGIIFEFIFKRSNLITLCDPGQDCITASSYALIGAAATLSGVTRLTVSSVVIFYELTGNMSFVIPTMIATLISTWTANFFNKYSLVERLIQLNHLPYLNSKMIDHTNTSADVSQPLFSPLLNLVFSPIQESSLDVSIIKADKSSIPNEFIQQVLDHPIHILRIDQLNTVRSLIIEIQDHDQLGLMDTGFPILLDKQLVGFIEANELKFALKSVREHGLDVACYFTKEQVEKIKKLQVDTDLSNYNDFTLFVNYAPVIISPESSQDFVFQLFLKLGVRYVCVVDLYGVFLGIIHKKRIISFLSN